MQATIDRPAVGDKVLTATGGKATITSIQGDVITTGTGLDWNWDSDREWLVSIAGDNGHEPATKPVYDYRRLGEQLHRWGANVTAIRRGNKNPNHKWKYLQGARQTAAELDALPWASAGGIGVINGSSDWRNLDIDAVYKENPNGPIVPREYVTAFLEALGLPADYPWCYRSGSGRGWHIWFRCDIGDLRGVIKRLPKGSMPEVDHFEFRWSTGQTVLNYKTLPSEPPAVVPIEAVYNALEALTLPKESNDPKQQKTIPESQESGANGQSVTIPQTAGAYGQAALNDVAQRVSGAAEGSRNNTLFNQAGAAFELENGGEIPPGAIEAALLPAALSAGLTEKEARATIESARKASEGKARTALETGAAFSTNGQTAYQLEDPETGEFVDRWGLMGPAQIMAPVPFTTYVVDRLLPLHSLSVLVAQSGSLKSLILMDQCVCVAGGKPWLPGANGIINGQGMGLQVEQAPTIWVDLDNGRLRTRRRIQALIRGHELPDNTPVYIISMPADPLLVGTDPASVDLLRQYIELTGARLVVIDNLATISGDVDENSAAMARVLFPFRNLVDDLGIALVIIHHTSKDGAHYRGSTAIRGAVDLLLHGVREKRSDIISIRTDKARDVRAPNITAQFHYEHEANGYDLRSACFSGTTDTTDHVRVAMLDVIREIGEMGLSSLADETYRQCKGLASRATIREIVKANIQGLPNVVLSEERVGKFTVRYEAVDL